MADVRDRLGRLIRNMGHATTDVKALIKHVAATGQVAANENQVTARLSLCQACDKFNGTTCALCGCHMKWKAMIASSTCPLGKWK